VHGGAVKDFLVVQESGGFRFYLMLLRPYGAPLRCKPMPR
jgi:hypothetical protein